MRWRKLRGDARAMRGRLAILIAALAISLVGFGSVLGARAVLQREIAASYLSGAPAEATLALRDGVDDALLAALRARPELAAVDRRAVIAARVATTTPAKALGEALHHGAPRTRASAPLLLFVDDAARDPRRVSRTAPDARGALALERTAVGVIGAGAGDVVQIQLPRGGSHALAIDGLVHDTALAPAWQERRGTAYVARATLAALGEDVALTDLYVRFAPAPRDQAAAEAAATALARWLVARGQVVREVRVPWLHRHPHEGQMRMMQTTLLVFGALLVALSAVLVATLLGALLARQIRELGVMKALGARTAQLIAMYAALVAAIGAAALVLALPLGWLGAQAIVARFARMLNLAIADARVPAWVYVVELAAGLAVPLAFAAVPIVGACRRSVRDALADHGTGARIWFAPTWLPHAVRNALRTPGRLALSLALLVVAGALAITAANLQAAFRANVARLPQMWHFDLDVVLASPAPASLAASLAQLPGVRAVEAWGDSSAAWQRGDAAEIVHTYPDQGHGRFHVYGAPPATTLATLPVIDGRWLRADDRDAIVMSRGRVGDRLDLVLDGHPSTWTVVGIVDALPAAAFVTDAALARVIGPGAQRFRVAFVPGADPTQAIERRLREAGAAVELAMPFALLRGALDDHVVVIGDAALVVAAILALVGLLGLGAALSIGVVERTRELGVLKAMGAGPRRIYALVVGEALAIAALSAVLALALALPFTHHLAQMLGRAGALGPRFAISLPAIAGWLALLFVGSVVASALPARRAARLTVHAALSTT